MSRVYYSKKYVSIRMGGKEGTLIRIPRKDILSFEEFYDDELELNVLRVEYSGGVVDAYNVDVNEALRMDLLLK